MVMLGKTMTKVFGSRNDRLVKRFRKVVGQINALEAKVQQYTDANLRERTAELSEGLRSKKLKPTDVLPEAFAIIRETMDRNIGIRNIFNPEYAFNPETLTSEAAFNAYAAVEDQIIQTGQSWMTIDLPVELYAEVRRLYPDSRPPFRARCFDVQLIGGLVLYEGKIAEMATGEGKTFVAPLACFMRAMEGYRVHVITVNDYLVKRDASWVKPAFAALGMSVGYIQSDMDPGGDARKRMYECNITYGTNSEFGFDYLRDNMKENVAAQVQGPLDFAIIDEVDSVLIDEARTPLIISGAAHDDPKKYAAADVVARQMMELNRPWTAIEHDVDAAKRQIKAAEGDEEKARTKEQREAARKRILEAQETLVEAEKKKEGVTQYYERELDKKSVHLTHEGIAAAQEAAGVGSFYVGENMEWPHMMDQAMRAHVVYEKDKDYVVERNPQNGKMEVVIVDEYTGRKMTGRQWSDGLHQAVEAKEKVTIKEETQTLATITLQNFFKLYKFLSGMTGTAQTESEEFMKIYQLEVVTIPTNRPIARRDHDDRVYRTEQEKWEAIIDEIKAFSDAGRPVLVGTTSVEKSEGLSRLLKRKYGIDHEVLNAKYHEREAQIVAIAGQVHENTSGEVVGNVTIATNMAGRGTDIKPVPESLFDVTPADEKYTLTPRAKGKPRQADAESPLLGVFDLKPTSKLVGGLHVIGTERHTSRRIDNQLRGRSGRQGDPGSSRFFCSLQDDLLKMFMGEWTINIMKRIGMEYGEAIESGMLTKGIVRAQKKVEERNFLQRKNLLDYDEVMDKQRSSFYSRRQQVLEGRHIERVVWDMIGAAIEDAVEKYISSDYIAANIAEWARTDFDVVIEPAELKGMRKVEDLEDYVRSAARLELETSLSQTLGEFMGEEPDDPDQWDVKQIASFAQTRYGLSLPPAELRKMDGATLEEVIKEAALEKIEARDTGGLMQFLEPNYAATALADWANDKFGVKLSIDEIVLDDERGIHKPAPEIVRMIDTRARAAYQRREIEYPVDRVLELVAGEGATQIQNPYAADYLRNWSRAKYNVELSLDYIGQSPVRQLRDELIGHQERYLLQGELEKDVDAIMATADAKDYAKLAEAFNARFGTQLTQREINPRTAGSRKGRTEEDEDQDGKITSRDVILRLGKQILRDELTRLEQYVLISIFDQAWKDHLYAMDALKSGIGLHAFAEKDPRVLYKKEGYDYYEQMLEGIRDKVTGLIFHVEVRGQEVAARNNYQVTSTQHDTEQSYDVGENARETGGGGGGGGGGELQTSGGGENSGGGAVVQTIVREGVKVGRNDPCPCGSGKKFKNCHGQVESV